MKRPEVAAPLPWPFPSPQRLRLDNGLDVQAFHRPGQHLIDATLVIDLPLSTEPAATEGVSTIVQRCLDEGTATHPGTLFTEELESRGAVLGVGSSHDAAHVSFEVPATRLTEALPLFAEAVREPALEESDVRRHIDLRLAEIEQQRAHPVHRGAQAFRGCVVAAQCRASRPPAGTTETVSAITTADVRAQHARRYRPERATLVIAGDFGTSDVLRAVSDAFGSWPAGAAAATAELPWADRPRAVLVDRPGAVQADVRLGTFGIDRTDPRWPALRLGLFALGGGFLSRLNRVLREERGYTYGVQLANTPSRHGGLLAMHASFRTEVAAAAIAEARDLIRVDADRAITAAELAEAANFLIGITPLRCATASGLVDQVAALAEAGLASDFVDTHAEDLQRVTPDQATRAIAQLLPADGLTLVVVGDAEVLADPIRTQGYDLEVLTDQG